MVRCWGDSNNCVNGGESEELNRISEEAKGRALVNVELVCSLRLILRLAKPAAHLYQPKREEFKGIVGKVHRHRYAFTGQQPQRFLLVALLGHAGAQKAADGGGEREEQVHP